MLEVLAGQAALSVAGSVVGKVARMAADVLLPGDGPAGATAPDGFRAELARLTRVRGLLAHADPEEMPIRDLEVLAASLRAAGTLSDADYEVLKQAQLGLSETGADLDRPRNLIDDMTRLRDAALQGGDVDALMGANRAISLLENLVELRDRLV